MWLFLKNCLRRIPELDNIFFHFRWLFNLKDISSVTPPYLFEQVLPHRRYLDLKTFQRKKESYFTCCLICVQWMITCSHLLHSWICFIMDTCVWLGIYILTFVGQLVTDLTAWWPLQGILCLSPCAWRGREAAPSSWTQWVVYRVDGWSDGYVWLTFTPNMIINWIGEKKYFQ